MAVASPCLSLPLSLSHSLLFLLSCLSSLPHSPLARTPRPSSLHRIHPTLDAHANIHACIYTCAHMKCVSCFRSTCTILLHLLLVLLRLFFASRPVPSSLLPVALTDARAVDSRVTTYVCLDLKIVRLWSLRAERGVPNEPEIRSQPRTRER